MTLFSFSFLALVITFGRHERELRTRGKMDRPFMANRTKKPMKRTVGNDFGTEAKKNIVLKIIEMRGMKLKT